MKTIERIFEEADKRHAENVKKCMSSPNPLQTAFAEVLRRWDDLGAYKDDDGGEVREAMEVAREVYNRVKNEALP